ncbi:MBL fold metallo-hydrolase [Actinoplanes sp. TRM 88003]|uniref:MBL fold metallo-hydrolase n=1 Tax=Paractinoplanes aksuensis TaxID=2939490 RepID=A0ABT1DUI7_9ACTN|nr:MBL fold metallo-hydrolase [Actinoplanes aksuensis]MCO8274518.1 MBL fold metallo-hydrolase [Actinoplanes aksuensis]
MGGVAPNGLPGWVTLLRAPNPGPMTLDGTNTWVLRAPGATHGAVIDPGPLDEGHLRRIADHGPYEFILITHGHHDHVEGAARLSEILGGTPVLAAGTLPAEMTVGGLSITTLDTPGHTSDSVCFLVESGNTTAMFTGDTILGRGTTVVAHPDGDLGAYLGSLERLSAYENVLMLPGHGPSRTDVAALAREYLAHRRERLAQVTAAMAAGASTAEQVVDIVYPDIDPAVRFAAIWSASAQLDYLNHKNGESGTPGGRLDPL